jgi:hypothetical protein
MYPDNCCRLQADAMRGCELGGQQPGQPPSDRERGARSPQEAGTDQFALGIFVDAGKGSPVITQATKRGKLQTKLGSVFCNDGDVVLAVRWLVRDESDAERRTFYEPSDEDEAGSVIPVNSTELRHAGFGLTVLEPSIRMACNAELESDVEDGGVVNGEDEWEDDDGESDEVIDDRGEEDSAYVTAAGWGCLLRTSKLR